MSKRQGHPGSQPDGAARRVDNPHSIRALAHPARLAIIDALAAGDELTATQCAEVTGLRPNATAYHLKLLQRYGFAEPAPGRPDRRERPWRATGRQTTLELDGSTPAGASAATAVAVAYLDATRAVALEFTEGEYAEPVEWRNAMLTNVDLWLTAEEAQRVSAELTAVLERFRAQSRAADRPAAGRRVRVMNVVVPHARRPK
jgi:DNA-binding transcriptional ArsR family regulator